MGKTTKLTPTSEETPDMVSVTFTRTYNSGEERYVRGQSYEVSHELAVLLQEKGVI